MKTNPQSWAGPVLAAAILAVAACGGGSHDESDTSTDDWLEAEVDVEAVEAPEVPEVPEDPGDEEARAPADDFALTDLNPLSSTLGSERRVSDQVGKVLVIYFANYT